MEKKIQEWIDTVQSNGCNIKTVTVLNEIRKPDSSLLFALIDAEVYDPQGNKLPNIVFIRGHACVVVPKVYNTESNKHAYLMVRQRRIGSGEDSLEFPAGMLDNESHNPLGVAMKEMFEETGLTVSKLQLFSLCKTLLYSSVGGSDEGIYYYGCHINVDNTQYISLHNRFRGNEHENERITVELVSREDAEERSRSTQVLLGIYLFDHYMKTHSV
ncbi:MAG: NUDIX hydrolase [Fibrobacterota bacterium]|nr:NUDIX hydrolase [Chitinispirillaceae bacterium]